MSRMDYNVLQICRLFINPIWLWYDTWQNRKRSKVHGRNVFLWVYYKRCFTFITVSVRIFQEFVNLRLLHYFSPYFSQLRKLFDKSANGPVKLSQFVQTIDNRTAKLWNWWLAKLNGITINSLPSQKPRLPKQHKENSLNCCAATGLTSLISWIIKLHSSRDKEFQSKFLENSFIVK